MLDGSCLLDFEHRVPLWQYQHSGENAHAVAPGGQYLYVCRDDSRRAAFLSMTRLPHPEALKAAESIKADEALLLKPGTKVSLLVDVPCSNEQRKQITAALTQRIKDAGLVLEENQPIAVHAMVEPGKSEVREYRRFGSPRFGGGGTEKVTVTPQISKVCIEADGRRAWEVRKSTTAGFMLNLKQGQTAQDAANEASRPDTAFFDTVRVPGYLPKPRDPAWFGASLLTEQGIRPAPLQGKPLEPERKTPDDPKRGPRRTTA